MNICILSNDLNIKKQKFTELIFANDIKKLKIQIPSLSEQTKIAAFLSSFDEKISIEKQTLEYLKEIKKGLLQQIFV